VGANALRLPVVSLPASGSGKTAKPDKPYGFSGINP